jgi:hypothetical protein
MDIWVTATPLFSMEFEDDTSLSKRSNKSATPNPAMTSLFYRWRYWRGVGEPAR